MDPILARTYKSALAIDTSWPLALLTRRVPPCPLGNRNEAEPDYHPYSRQTSFRRVAVLAVVARQGILAQTLGCVHQAKRFGRRILAAGPVSIPLLIP
jgi:hypothetical protein